MDRQFQPKWWMKFIAPFLKTHRVTLNQDGQVFYMEFYVLFGKKYVIDWGQTAVVDLAQTTKIIKKLTNLIENYGKFKKYSN